MNIEEFVSTSAEMLKTLLARSGAVLYSSVETLCPGSLYILGLNPGGRIDQMIGLLNACKTSRAFEATNIWMRTGVLIRGAIRRADTRFSGIWLI